MPSSSLFPNSRRSSAAGQVGREGRSPGRLPCCRVNALTAPSSFRPRVRRLLQDKVPSEGAHAEPHSGATGGLSHLRQHVLQQHQAVRPPPEAGGAHRWGHDVCFFLGVLKCFKGCYVFANLLFFFTLIESESLVCEHCGKAFPSERLLRDHIRQHGKNQPPVYYYKSYFLLSVFMR